MENTTFRYKDFEIKKLPLCKEKQGIPWFLLLSGWNRPSAQRKLKQETKCRKVNFLYNAWSLGDRNTNYFNKIHFVTITLLLKEVDTSYLLLVVRGLFCKCNIQKYLTISNIKIRQLTTQSYRMILTLVF